MNRIQKITGCLLVGAALYSTKADEVLTFDERVVALTILGEARGEGQIGMRAVGCVIQNRMNKLKEPFSGKPMDAAKVCLLPKQFSIWNGIRRESELYYLWDSKSMPYARKLARLVCKQKVEYITGGATHFCTLKTNPYWAKCKKPTKVIGNHKFFKIN